MRSGGKKAWALLLPKSLRDDCFTICYAVKPWHDALYYSRISTAQLARFLKRHRPGPILDALEAHSGDFAHVNWDLGFDFAADRPRAESISINKIGIYGVL